MVQIQVGAPNIVYGRSDMQFNIGFELEYLTPKSFKSTTNDLRKLGLPEGRYLIKDDYSVYSVLDNTLIPTEIVTPPLTEYKANVALTKLCKYMEDEGVVTNKTTGIHVNISPRLSSVKQKLNPETLIAVTDDYYIASRFNRQKNKYCTPWPIIVENLNKAIVNTPKNSYIKYSLTDEFSDLIRDLYLNSHDLSALHQRAAKKIMSNEVKYTSVNFSKIKRHGYIEYRMIGGPKYEQRVPEIKEAIEHFKEGQKLAVGKYDRDRIVEYLNWAKRAK